MNTENNAYSDYEIAGNMMEEHEKRDQQISIESILQRQGQFSGLNDFDYQDLGNLTEGRIKDLQHIRILNKIPIPNEIMENFKNIKCHCRMGLFPEIGRAWITIDSDIYIWTYENSRDVAYFDGLNHLIVSVGLIKPKPNVFINDVRYLLVLTTPIEVIVLGVTFGDTTKSVSSPSRSFLASTFEEMQLMNKPIFVLNTDNIAITCIEGSYDGRIFLGGKDGCLYEIIYQAESNWFGKRCKKINHSQGLLSYVLPGFLKGFSDDAIIKIVIDNQRNMLHVLTEKGRIEIWNISNSTAVQIKCLSQNDIINAAINHVKTVDASIFKPVVDICILERDEYSHLFLCAVTKSGVRFYFNCDAGGFQSNFGSHQEQLQKTQNVYLQHVRLPPGYTPNTNYGKPKDVHSIYHSSGSIMMISNSQPDQDFLWSLSSTPFLHSELSPLISNDSSHRMLTETSTTLHLDGSVWSINEVRDKNQLPLKYSLREAQQPKKIIILTSQGAQIIEIFNPINLLQQLFLACHGVHHDAIKSYFDLQNEVENCAISLQLACMESLRGTDMAKWGTQAFFRYGGEPYFYSQQQIHSNLQSNIQEGAPKMLMSTPYAMVTSRPVSQNILQQTQMSANNTFAYQQPQQLDLFNLKYSAKHDGLYLHVARILRPIWNRKCINEKILSTISVQDCVQVLFDLYAIRTFLDVNSIVGFSKLNLSSAPYSSFVSSNTTTNGFVSSDQFIHQQKKEEAFLEEKKSFDALVNFIKHVCEIISLWKILCEHQLHTIVNQFSIEHKQLLMSCTFRDLIISRTDLCALLIVTLINSYLNDNASVKLISEKLREVCPKLYKNEDAVSHKATEILKMSKSCTNEDERHEHFLKALELCTQAAPKLPLGNICQQFTAAGFYEGVIKLCTSFASKVDPNETALHFYINNYPFDHMQIQIKDQETFYIYNNRMKCYDEVKNMLEYVYKNLNSSVSNEQQCISLQLQNILNITLQSSDQLLHIAVYEWMLMNNLLIEMLSITNSSLGDFLSRSVTQTPINLNLADLLWKYYERNGQHSSASKILEKLASLHSDKILLTKRIEYLARAVICMRSDSVGYSVHHGEMLHDLEDKLEVAQIQKQIQDTMLGGNFRNIDSIQVREAVKSLDMRLFNMSQLFSDFAENFDLWECQLTILNCSHHNEPRLINSIWSHILDKELEMSGSETEKSQRLLLKVQSLSNELGISPCFPLDYLVEELELRCFQLKLSNSPVPDALFKMNIDVDQILDIYNRIVTVNDRVWLTEYDELFLIRSVWRLLTIIIQRYLSVSKNRRRTVAKMEDLISASLNALYTKQGTNETKEITRELRNIRQNINFCN